MSSRKRILIVTDLWLTHPNGVATVVHHLQKELEHMGHAVDLMEPGQFFTIPFPLYPEMRLALFAWKRIRKIVTSAKYDYIHIETEGPLGFFTRNACVRLRIPFTTSLHGQHHLYATKWLGKVVGRLVLSFVLWFHAPSKAVLVSTEPVKRQWESMGIGNVFVRPLGVEEMFFTRGTCPINLEKPVFMYMGRVSSEKSIDEFLSADLPGTKLVIGDGPDKKRLQGRFPTAMFVGAKKGKELIQWCSCGDVMVMPSRTETFGLAMVEVLALGIPVAAHDVTGPREIIENGINGYLDEDIASTARRCLTLSPANCTASVKQYSWSASAKTFLSLLESLQATR